MNRVHIVGRRNSGKTTLIVELVRELVGRGYTVGTIKHSSHSHELDTPGKDSHRHRLAGSAPAAVITPTTTAVYLPSLPGAPRYDELEPHYRACDLVLVEGDQSAPARKVEVWRAETGSEPLVRSLPEIAAVITDDPIDVPVPVWPRAEVTRLADFLLLLGGEGEVRRQKSKGKSQK